MSNKNLRIWDSQDCAIIFIDYQPEMFKAIRSSDPRLIELNVCLLARAAKAFNIPVILSTVGVEMGVNQPTIRSLKTEIPDANEIDRSSMNAWEDDFFLKAVKETQKKRLVFAALWTEVCLAFPAIEALGSDYEVAIVVDAVGGQTKIAHETAISRMTHAGAVPNTTSAMVYEWFHDWKSPLAQPGKEALKPYWSEISRYYKREPDNGHTALRH